MLELNTFLRTLFRAKQTCDVSKGGTCKQGCCCTAAGFAKVCSCRAKVGRQEMSEEATAVCGGT